MCAIVENGRIVVVSLDDSDNYVIMNFYIERELKNIFWSSGFAKTKSEIRHPATKFINKFLNICAGCICVGSCRRSSLKCRCYKGCGFVSLFVCLFVRLVVCLFVERKISFHVVGVDNHCAVWIGGLFGCLFVCSFVWMPSGKT